jgi:hypothetical protein
MTQKKAEQPSLLTPGKLYEVRGESLILLYPTDSPGAGALNALGISYVSVGELLFYIGSTREYKFSTVYSRGEAKGHVELFHTFILPTGEIKGFWADSTELKYKQAHLKEANK